MKKPTANQVRYHYKKIDKLISKLELAIWQAKDAGVLQYDQQSHAELSPMRPLYDVYTRFDNACEKQLAQAMRDEISRGK